jgi:hypothetical protein
MCCAKCFAIISGFLVRLFIVVDDTQFSSFHGVALQSFPSSSSSASSSLPPPPHPPPPPTSSSPPVSSAPALRSVRSNTAAPNVDFDVPPPPPPPPPPSSMLTTQLKSSSGALRVGVGMGGIGSPDAPRASRNYSNSAAPAFLHSSTLPVTVNFNCASALPFSLSPSCPYLSLSLSSLPPVPICRPPFPPSLPPSLPVSSPCILT